MKNKLSVTQKVLFTRGIIGISSIFLGIASFLVKYKPVSYVFFAIAVVLMIFSLVVKFKGDFDIWDETASINYKKALKTSYDLVCFVIGIILICMIAFDLTLMFNFCHLDIIYGILELLPVIFFVIEEKRS